MLVCDCKNGTLGRKCKEQWIKRKHEWQRVQKVFKPGNKWIRYKRCKDCIVELELLRESKTNESRGYIERDLSAKFRASSIRCNRIYNIKKRKCVNKIEHHWTTEHPILYQVGCTIYPDKFESDINLVCAPGIHYFKSLEAAFGYKWFPLQSDGLLTYSTEYLHWHYLFDTPCKSDESSFPWITFWMVVVCVPILIYMGQNPIVQFQREFQKQIAYWKK
jgi:hypothetical protein